MIPAIIHFPSELRGIVPLVKVANGAPMAATTAPLLAYEVCLEVTLTVTLDA